MKARRISYSGVRVEEFVKVLEAERKLVRPIVFENDFISFMSKYQHARNQMVWSASVDHGSAI